MKGEKIVKSKLKCSKCKSTHLILIEVWVGHEITWKQINGEFDRDDGNLEHGSPHHVEARCRKCGHMWKPQNCPQIDYVITGLIN